MTTTQLAPQESSAEVKLDSLKRILSEMSGVVVAFSGGTDSALLLKVAHDELGEKAIAVTATSSSLPREELEYAAELASQLGVRPVSYTHLTLPTTPYV